MMAARLTIAAVTSVIAGAVAGWISRGSVRVACVVGAILLAVFLPEHVRLLERIPDLVSLDVSCDARPLVVYSFMAYAHTHAWQAGGRGLSGQPAIISDRSPCRRVSRSTYKSMKFLGNLAGRTAGHLFVKRASAAM